MKYIKLILSLSVFSSAHAVNINPGGYGEAIILPYYTVNNGLNTLLTINNSTDMVKAVKVHFREGKEGKAVLTFNAYLAPQDLWTAGLVPTVSSIPNHNGENSAALVHADNSCVPFLTQMQQFLPYEYEVDTDDTDLQRSREGYIEILEMGELDPDSGLGEAATFDNSGAPIGCGDIEMALGFGVWNETDGDLTEQLLPVKGGLSASVGIIDVAEGTLYSYDGVAFENFYPIDSIYHTSPGDTGVPSLEQADTTSLVINHGDVVTTEWEMGYQAISAVLMKSQVENFYSTESGVAAETEIVFSFPTKRLYPSDDSPFSAIEGTQDAGCAGFDVSVFDRESELLWCSDTEECLTVLPPPGVAFQMCNSINVLRAGQAEDSESNEILGANSYTYLEAIGSDKAGKLNIDFSQNMTAGNSDSYSGVPVIALTFEKYTNANAAPGLLAQYGGIYTPKHKTEITSN